MGYYRNVAEAAMSAWHLGSDGLDSVHSLSRRGKYI